MIEETKTAAPAPEPKKRRIRVPKNKPNAAKPTAEGAKRKLSTGGKDRKKAAAAPKEPETLYRIERIPRGRALTHYTVAVLTVIGAYTPHRKAFGAEQLTGFYNTGKAVAWHLGNGNLERTASGDVRLSADGRDHFRGLTEGNPTYEKKVKPEIDALVAAMQTGVMPAGTVNFSQDAKFIPVPKPE
jgi:hypothetical protein